MHNVFRGEENGPLNNPHIECQRRNGKRGINKKYILSERERERASEHEHAIGT